MSDFLMQYLRHTLQVTITYSIPATFIYLSFNVVFWGFPFKEHWRKVMLFSILQSLLGSITILIAPIWLHTLTFLIEYLLLFFLMFRTMTWMDRTIISVFGYIIAIFVEMASYFLATRFINGEDRFEQPIFMMLPASLFICLFAGLTVWMGWRKISPGKPVVNYLKKQNHNFITYLFLFMFMQFIVITLLMLYLIEPHRIVSPVVVISLLFVVETISVIFFFLTLRLISRSKEDAVTSAQQVYLKDIDQMFTTIRGQRHDFLNHVQVLRSMIERDKMTDFLRYTKELLAETSEVNEIIQIGNPAIAALIQSKTALCLDYKIKLQYDFSGLGELTSGIKTIDIVKILGNLLDNAIDEVLSLTPENRWVEVTGSLLGGYLSFSVRNPGALLTNEDISNILGTGFSTKDVSKHSGIGLSIVQERVHHYKGHLSVDSSVELGTIFSVGLRV
jgi:signal transduction histidine kinase